MGADDAGLAAAVALALIVQVVPATAEMIGVLAGMFALEIPKLT